LTFPRGERSFIESVKAVRNQVKSPALRADVAGFVGQEALHSREHDALNDVLEGMGYPIRALEKEFSARLDEREKSMSKKSALAFTAAMEHMTALFGRILLTREDVRAMIHPELRAIWLWHALEEIEHKAIAFDVYQEVFDDDTTRRAALILATGAFLTFTHYCQYQLLKRDGLANKPSVWAKGLWKLWGPKGLGRSAIPTWVEYLRRDFHPWQEDDSALIAEFETSVLPRATA
jgi:predicted metal-dependent hydrolase